MKRGDKPSLLALGIACLLVGSITASSWAQDDRFSTQRETMIESQIIERGIEQTEVIEAMRAVPRHLFVPPDVQSQAYEDHPVPIGWEQTISQPYIVALMSQLLELGPDDRVLEIGTGSGYLAAILSKLAREVYTIEIIDPLGQQAKDLLRSLDFDNVHVRVGDGYKGWPEAAPFDAIVLTAAPSKIPEPLIEQLAIGGRMVVPVGSFLQDLQLIVKTEEGLVRRKVAPVRFEQMQGEVLEP